MPNPEKFGLYVRRHRLNKKITLRNFSIATEIDSCRIGQLERHATTKPPLKYEIEAFARVLGLEFDVLKRIAEDFAPDMDAVERDKDPLKHAVFACRTEE